MTRRLIAMFLLLTAAACAQFQSGPSEVARRLRIRVAFGDHAACDSSTRVVLTGAMGFAMAEGSVNGECVAEFFDVPAGRYRVSVEGGNAANADEGDIEVNSVISEEAEVHAKHTQESDANHFGTASFVSIAELGMPSGAAKEFEKAGRLIEKQDWERASGRLRKGLSSYSSYAAGYNNLGAVYLHLGNYQQAQEALQKAITLNDRLAPAYVNLARLSFIEKDFPAAESFLNKASTLSSPDADALSMLAYAQLTNKHLPEAIDTSHRGHTLKVRGHSYVHLVAARAYELQKNISDSIHELQDYLKEAPNGARADQVRQAISTLQGLAGNS